jgi:ATP-dependent Clp protease, protease subunit
MHELRLYGPIGGYFGYSADEVMSQIPEDAKDITVRIHSPGGIVGEGIAMYHALKAHKGSVTTVIDGDAHSIASIVFLAGDKRITHKASRMLVHDPWVGEVTGNSEDLRRVADRLDETGDAILDIYEDETGLSRDELADLMDESRYMRGSEMKEKGFATDVANDEKAELAIAAMLRESDLVAIKAKDNTMSTQKTRKDIQTELDASIAEVESVKVSAKAELDESKAAITVLETNVSDRESQIVELSKARDEAIADVESGKLELAEVSAKVETLEADAVKSDEQIKELEAKVSSPAYKAAQLKDVEGNLVPSAADAEADAAEAKAKLEAKSKEVSHYGEYKALMADGKSKEAKSYHRAHKTEIVAEQKAIIESGE